MIRRLFIWIIEAQLIWWFYFCSTKIFKLYDKRIAIEINVNNDFLYICIYSKPQNFESVSKFSLK